MGINDRRSVTITTQSNGNVVRDTFLRKAALKAAKNGYYPTDVPVRLDIIVESPSPGSVWLVPILLGSLTAIRDVLIVDDRQVVSLSVQSRKAKNGRITVRCSEIDTREVAS